MNIREQQFDKRSKQQVLKCYY